MSPTCIWLAINGSCLLKGRSAESLLSWWCGRGPIALRILLLRLQSILGRRRACDSLAWPQRSVLAAPVGWWVRHNGVKWGPGVSAARCWRRILLPLCRGAVILSVVIRGHAVMLRVLWGYRGNRVRRGMDLGLRGGVKSRPWARRSPSLRVAVRIVVGAVVGARWWSFSRRGILRRHSGVTMLRNTGIVIWGRIHGWVSLTWSCGMRNNKSQTGNKTWSPITSRC